MKELVQVMPALVSPGSEIASGFENEGTNPQNREHPGYLLESVVIVHFELCLKNLIGTKSIILA